MNLSVFVKIEYKQCLKHNNIDIISVSYKSKKYKDTNVFFNRFALNKEVNIERVWNCAQTRSTILLPIFQKFETSLEFTLENVRSVFEKYGQTLQQIRDEFYSLGLIEFNTITKTKFENVLFDKIFALNE